MTAGPQSIALIAVFAAILQAAASAPLYIAADLVRDVCPCSSVSQHRKQEKVLIEINMADSIAGLVELCTVGYALLTHLLHASAHLLPPIS